MIHLFVNNNKFSHYNLVSKNIKIIKVNKKAGFNAFYRDNINPNLIVPLQSTPVHVNVINLCAYAGPLCDLIKQKSNSNKNYSMKICKKYFQLIINNLLLQ